MKFLRASAAIILSGFASLAAIDPASDDFERATLGTNWTRLSGSDAEIVNGSDLGKPTANWVFVGWIGSGFDADQFCEAVIAAGKSDTLLTQVYVRRRTSDLARYGFHFNDENEDGTGIANPRWEIKYDGVPSAQTRILASVPTSVLLPGDTLRIEVRGVDPVFIKGFHNGVEVISAIDSAPQRITGHGMQGMVSRVRRGPYTAPANAPVFASWRGGSLAPVLTVQRTGAGMATFLLSFGTVTNRSYSVQFASDISSTNWMDLTTVFGDGTEKSLAVTNVSTQRFYRVQRN